MCNREPTSKFDTAPFIWFLPYISFHITLYVILQIRTKIYIHYMYTETVISVAMYDWASE